MHEDIISFVPDEGRTYPLFVDMMGTSYCDGGYRIGRNPSELLVIEYVRKGLGTVTVDGRKFQAAAGDVYLLPLGSRHDYRSDARDPWVKVWVNVHGPLADGLLDAYGLRDVNLVTGLDLSDLFDELLAAGGAAGGNADVLLPQAALLLLRMMERIHAHVRRQGAGPSPEIVSLKTWLDSRIGSHADMGELADSIYRSPSHMTRIFKRSYGITPYEYLVRRRLETAKSMLLNTTISIKEIAYRLEFADEHYFSNVFHKRTGMSPSRFRCGPRGVDE